jgi:hypothetical protein
MVWRNSDKRGKGYDVQGKRGCFRWWEVQQPLFGIVDLPQEHNFT